MRYVPALGFVLGYLCVLAGLALVDLRAALIGFGLACLYEAREVSR